MTVAAVLTAAGSGSRLGHTLPKALVALRGEPLVTHAARRLLAARGVRAERVTVLVVTAPAAHADAVRDALRPVAVEDGVVVRVVLGGATRQASVAAGLAVVEELAADDGADGPVVVLVHDAARPFVPPEMVARVVDAVRDGHAAVVPGLPLADTVKQVSGEPPAGGGGEAVVGTVPRAALRAVQTPQGFELGLLRRAHAEAAHHADDESVAASDDAGLVERLGVPVWLVPGDERAGKITTARDLAVAELLGD